MNNPKNGGNVLKRIICLILLSFTVLIPSNTAKSLVYYTVSSSSLFNSDGISSSSAVVSSPLGGEITFKEYDLAAAGYSGAVFGGGSVYLVPYNSNEIVCVKNGGDIETLALPDGLKTEGVYSGGATDGMNVYFSPYNAKAPLILNIETKNIAPGDDFPAEKFSGAIFDGEFTWFLPETGKNIVCMDALGVIKLYEIPYAVPSGSAFSGGVFTHEKIYLIPNEMTGVITLDINTGEFSKPDSLSSVTGCSGGVFEGDLIYLIPFIGDSMYIINTTDNSFEKIAMPEIENAMFSGGAYDGRNIWMAPYSGGTVVKYDIYTGEFTSYELLDTTQQYKSGAFDGENVWLSPLSGKTLLRISGTNNPPVAMNLFLEVEVGGEVSGEFSAQDENSGDTISFRTETQPSLGTLIYDSATGKFTYTAGTLSGIDEFYYTAYDGYDRSNAAKVTITVKQKATETGGLYIDLWDHWAEDAALDLTEQGVLLGEKVDNYHYFYPDSFMSRGQFAVMANSAFGFEGSFDDDTLPFDDVPGDPAWVRLAASAAYHGNMVQGSPSGDKLYFNYNEPLKRIEALTMIYNVIRPKTNENIVSNYADRGIFPAWSLDIINGLTYCGLLKGYEDKTVRPFNKVTRAEAAVMLSEALRYYNSLGKKEEMLK